MLRLRHLPASALALPAMMLAASPAASQSRMTAPATEVVSAWSDICLAHAGDPKAQRRAAEQSRPDFPVQVQFLGDEADPICIVISVLDEGQSYENLLEAARTAFDFSALAEVKDQASGMSSVATINSRKFRVSFSTKQTQDRTVAMAVIGEMKASK
ncbi:hypothetical protein [Erythrobacter sp. WG]|uniref:hypothetical protein n=1 Tax=Erythrobacter sp. WG TaxID=2985510 RepID=UPI002271EF93|nr:hypothetical protein [Erythrobacter sp. WG]MCX9148082.1 hypothetical protein [Erythrobacter sp. WG]